MPVTATKQIDIFDYIFESYPTTTSPHLPEAEEHVRLVHNQNDVFISLGKKYYGEWHQYACRYNQLMDKLNCLLSSPDDVYMGINAFRDRQRKLTSLNLLQGLYTDLDFYKSGPYQHLSPAEMWSTLQRDIFEAGVFPWPSLVLCSGRGMQLLWLIEKVPATSKSTALYQRTQEYVQEIFAPYGADPASQDATHVFRLAGTINSKNGNTVDLWTLSDIPYTLRYFQTQVLPPLEDRPPKIKKQKRSSIKHLYKFYSLHWARLQDLEILQQIRQGKCEGLREIMCFLHRYWSCCYISDPVQALEETLIFNRGFNSPLSEKEVRSATKSAEKAFMKWLKEQKAGYNYTNKRLVELLEISPEEQQQLKTIIGTAEKYSRSNEKRRTERRDDEGRTARQQSRDDKKQKVMELQQKGLKQVEIARELGISKQLVRYYYEK